MRLVEEADGSIVVKNLSWWTLMFTALFACAAWAIWHRVPPRRGDGLWTVVVGAASLLGLAGLEVSHFRFDVPARRLDWSRRTPFRRSSGTLAFDRITGISMELMRSSSGSGGGGRRIDLHTPDGIVPVTSSYSGFYGGQLRIAQRISALVGCKPPVVA